MTFHGISLAITLCLTLCVATRVWSDYGFRSDIIGISGHNLILGRLGYGDRVLFHNVVIIPRSFFGTVSQDIRYPPYGNSLANITYIRVIDLKTDGTGGYPHLISGGIGYKNVTIRLNSQRGYGLNFNVTLFGR